MSAAGKEDLQKEREAFARFSEKLKDKRLKIQASLVGDIGILLKSSAGEKELFLKAAEADNF